MVLTTVRPLPLPSFYSFDAVSGSAFQIPSPLLPPLRPVVWNAHNPYYDPGPPPEKPIKPSEGLKQTSASVSNDSPVSPSSVGSTPPPRPAARRHDGGSVSDDRRHRHRRHRGGPHRSEGPRVGRHRPDAGASLTTHGQSHTHAGVN